MAKYAYWANSLTGGGTGALDAIDGANLNDLDMAIVVTGSNVYIYSLDADSGAAESSPNVISPDANAGNKRWILVQVRNLPNELENLTTAEIQQLENIGATTISSAQWGYLGACTAAGGALLDDADADTQLGTLGLSTELKNLTTAEIQQLENIGATTISAAQWGYLGALTTHPISGDGTAGRILRGIYLAMEDGTNANTLKCSVTSFWNGDNIAVTDNIAKDTTTGHFRLDSTGKFFYIKNTGLSGNCVYAIGVLARNQTGTAATCDVYPSANDIVVRLRNNTTDAALDFTILVDSGFIRIYIFYITDA